MQVRFNTHGWRGGRKEDWVWGISDCGAAPWRSRLGGGELWSKVCPLEESCIGQKCPTSSSPTVLSHGLGATWEGHVPGWGASMNSSVNPKGVAAGGHQLTTFPASGSLLKGAMSCAPPRLPESLNKNSYFYQPLTICLSLSTMVLIKTVCLTRSELLEVIIKSLLITIFLFLVGI